MLACCTLQERIVGQAQGQCDSTAGRHASRMMTEVIALSMCTMHARRRRLTWFQHVNLQTLRAGKLDLWGWLRVAVRLTCQLVLIKLHRQVPGNAALRL